MVSMESMATLMASIETHLSDLIAQNEDEVAHLVVGDVKISQSSRSTDAIVTVTSGLGIGGSWGFYVPFANEEWYYGETAGRCDIPDPIYSDAGEELEWRFNSLILFMFRALIARVLSELFLQILIPGQ